MNFIHLNNEIMYCELNLVEGIPHKVIDHAGLALPFSACRIKHQEQELWCIFTKKSNDHSLALHLDSGTSVTIANTQNKPSYLDWLKSLTHYSNISQFHIRESLGKFLISNKELTNSLKLFEKLQQEYAPAQQNAQLGEIFFLSLDCLYPLENGAVIFAGYIADPFDQLESIKLTTPFGDEFDITASVLPHSGSKDKRCFSAMIPQQPHGTSIYQIRARYLLSDEKGGIVITPTRRQDPKELRRKWLSFFPKAPTSDNIVAHHISLPLLAIQSDIAKSASIAHTHHFGMQPKKPKASIIIPLYGEYGFVRHQLSSFWHDPMLKDVELIYHLDKPEDAEHVHHLLKGLFVTFGVPFKLSINRENYGYGLTNNLAANEASGEFLVLMNSDVVPHSVGWLETWMNQHQSQSTVGISGPKLLYADESLQHAGLYFEKGLMPWWTNNHYFKGYPKHFPSANQNRLVPAVTGACILLKRSLFKTLGGFSHEYILGDFEDSDLCLRTRVKGLDIQYFANISLFHMERISMSSNTDYSKSNAVRFNGWLHNQKWSKVIGQFMEQFG